MIISGNGTIWSAKQSRVKRIWDSVNSNIAEFALRSIRTAHFLRKRKLNWPKDVFKEIGSEWYQVYLNPSAPDTQVYIDLVVGSM